MAEYRRLSIDEAIERRDGMWSSREEGRLGSLADAVDDIEPDTGVVVYLFEPVGAPTVDDIARDILDMITDAVREADNRWLAFASFDQHYDHEIDFVPSDQTEAAIRALAESLVAHDVTGEDGPHDPIACIEVTTDLIAALEAP